MVIKSVSHRKYTQDYIIFKGKKYNLIAYSFSRKEAINKKNSLNQNARRKKRKWDYKVRAHWEYISRKGEKLTWGIFANYKK